MAEERKRQTKGETLTIRLDAKSRFMLEFMARVRGQTITTVVERSLHEAASALRAADGSQMDWRDYWHVTEGIRALRLSRSSQLFPTYDEELKAQFADAHWEFFYLNTHRNEYKPQYIDIIWPRIDEYVALWLETRATDYFAAGRLMREAILASGIQAPDWPRENSKTKTSPRAVPAVIAADDDEPL